MAASRRIFEVSGQFGINLFWPLFQIGNLGNLGKVVSVVQNQAVQSGVIAGQAASNTVAQLLQVLGHL